MLDKLGGSQRPLYGFLQMVCGKACSSTVSGLITPVGFRFGRVFISSFLLALHSVVVACVGIQSEI